MTDDALTGLVIGAFYHVYNALGYGYYESVYMAALQHELELRRVHVAREVAFDVVYKGRCVGRYRLDMLVGGRVVIEAKATETLPASAKRQLYNYLHGAHYEVGLVLHFGPEPKAHRVCCARGGGGTTNE